MTQQAINFEVGTLVKTTYIQPDLICK